MLGLNSFHVITYFMALLNYQKSMSFWKFAYILIDYEVTSSTFDCSVARKQNKVVQWFGKPLLFHFEHRLKYSEIWRRFQIRSQVLLNYPFKGTILGTIWIVSSQTLNFEMYYFITWWTFFTECWCNGLLNGVLFTYQKIFGGTGTLWRRSFPKQFMQIGWMESDFRNLTAKIWQIWIIQSRAIYFFLLLLISCMPPSQVVLCLNMWYHSSRL